VEGFAGVPDTADGGGDARHGGDLVEGGAGDPRQRGTTLEAEDSSLLPWFTMSGVLIPFRL
ncbi:hypothetical protein AB0E74_20830, partial [Streptomyces sp. NPDC030392]|uniref:hypothetical protein n=1 Tax=Streptomyces sp. NPDC030392 TaxID=3155468 RepID=UPI0033DFC54B